MVAGDALRLCNFQHLKIYLDVILEQFQVGFAEGLIARRQGRYLPGQVVHLRAKGTSGHLLGGDAVIGLVILADLYVGRRDHRKTFR